MTNGFEISTSAIKKRAREQLKGNWCKAILLCLIFISFIYLINIINNIIDSIILLTIIFDKISFDNIVPLLYIVKIASSIISVILISPILLGLNISVLNLIHNKILKSKTSLMASLTLNQLF